MPSAVSDLQRRLVGLATATAGRVFRRWGRRRIRTDPDHVVSVARRVMERKRYCLLVTESPDGPHARVLQPFRPDADLVVTLGTARGSRKVREIERTGRAMLVYQDDSRLACVSLYCRAEVLMDPETRRRRFMPFWRAFFPQGPSGEFVVIRCVPHTIEVWDGLRGVTPEPFGLRNVRLERRMDRWAPVL